MKKIILSLAIIAPIICNAQVTFTNMASLLQPVNGSYGNLASDMNGDHLDDIVRVAADGIYIDYQQPGGGFQGAFYPMAIVNLPSWSICAADIDANGYNDLCLGAGNAVSFVYANDSGTGYTEVAHPEYIFTQRTTFADIDNDGNLDAFANHDVDQCHPYRNVNGELVLDFSLIQTLDVGGNYAAIWVDYDNDWDQDLYITKCRGGAAWGDAQRINLLYKNNGDGTFTEAGAEANLNDGNQSWVTCFEDFDNDGDFDAFIVNHYSGDVPGGSANKFMRNNGDGTFTDIIASTGINAEDLGAWNADAWDFDNNGYVDVYSEMATNWYWNNGDGTFTAGASTGFTRAGIGDFNNDGYMDAISGNSLWMNDGNQNHYIKFNLEGIVSNRSALGARIEIYGDFGMQVREVRSGESFSPGSTLSEHFGLGSFTSVDQVIIKWPSQQVTTINNPAIDQTHYILEASCMNPPIAIAASGATEICPGQSVILTAPSASTYTWNTGANTSTLEVTESGSYYVVAFDASGCAAVSNNIVVTVIEESLPTIQMIGESVACEGEEVILTSSAAATYEWSEGSNGQSIVVSETGDYYVQVSGQCSGVFYTSEMIHVEILSAPAPVANDITVNANSTATLVAAGENLQWYDSSDLTNSVGSGSTFTTPVITNNTSYWVQSETTYGGEAQVGGMLAYNINSGGLPSTGGVLFFNATEPFTLEQVTVNVPSTSSAGPRTIQLFDASNAVIQELIVDCDLGENVITLNFDVPAGNALSIGCAENNLFRTNAGLAYPYSIGDIGEIYGSTNGTGYYYYFYNWQIRKQSFTCLSEPTEVEITVVGIESNESLYTNDIYPNPATETLNFRWSGSMDIIILRDAAGQQVATLNCNGKQMLSISPKLADGFYSAEFVSGANRQRKSFVIIGK